MAKENKDGWEMWRCPRCEREYHSPLPLIGAVCSCKRQKDSRRMKLVK